MSENQIPILVTGAHRSGTTWVGKMLAAGGDVGYISEPMNVLHRPGVFSAPVKHWYTYICEENQAQFIPAFQDTLQFKYQSWQEAKSLRSVHDMMRMGRDWNSFTHARVRSLRPLLKDPFALFSVPWFIQQWGCQVVITVRHPAAFTSSLKRLGWEFDFRDLIEQPLLMRDHLEPYRDDMKAVMEQPIDIITSSSLLWRMIYQAVAGYQEANGSIIIIRHEDLSAAPLDSYKILYGQLNLDFTPEAEAAILQSSGSHNPEELAAGAVHAIKLDSQANIHNWKHRLTPDEVSQIRHLTADVAALYYSDADWQ